MFVNRMSEHGRVLASPKVGLYRGVNRMDISDCSKMFFEALRTSSVGIICAREETKSGDKGNDPNPPDTGYQPRTETLLILTTKIGWAYSPLLLRPLTLRTRTLNFIDSEELVAA
ncbi:hypothetical protein G7Y89_g6515 [Cudoniella acicularis]|uniref:Uncharacterized protein n=1 Tax=Cudoniella acicularis TaxID=354080 RepID=A0A8H4W2T0_9HELO|nr:hypothetical protein G7Y89_g6515 [Cudoniella acicularis]